MPRCLALALLVLTVAVAAAADEAVPAQPSVVTIDGRRLLLQRRNPDGTLAPAVPYVIRGVNWSPADAATASGSPADRRKEFGEWYLTDIPLMKAMNVNTVRFFIDPSLPGDAGITVPGLTVLDELYRNGMMAILTVDDGNYDVSRIALVVDHYRNHPAVLMWSIGSEWNINRFFGKFATPAAAAAAVETAAQLVKSHDAGHPVVSSYGTIVDKPNAFEQYVNVTCPSIDVWSFNEYRGASFSRFFDQWTLTSGKPMFVGEYGIDAYDSTAGAEAQHTHAVWGGHLWDDLARNLSADDPGRAALGGVLFEWNDEWWKAGAPTTQDPGGWASVAFPDGYASEDWWGIVNVERLPRELYATLAARFAAGYAPPPRRNAATYQAESIAPIPACPPETRVPAYARFREDGALMYVGSGMSVDGGRGFNIAAIDPATGRLRDPIQRFDTWAGRDSPYVMEAMVAYLDALPNGTILLIAVGDEAGLNRWPPDDCTFLPYAWVTTALQRLQALGSTRIGSYCYCDQWAMVTVKGTGVALSESLSHSGDAVTEARIHAPWTDDPLVGEATPVKAIHLTELRDRINVLRVVNGLAEWSWTDPLTPQHSPVRAQHVLETRAALAGVYSRLGLPPVTYTDAGLTAGVPIRTSHVAEVRAALVAVE